MSASVEQYLTIVDRAFEGRIKLPAFQRKWKWKQGQVILLFDSLRQGYPVGGFLFIKENKKIDLAPRELQGASADAKNVSAEYLVLDGQQRITAGLELFHRHGERHYFLDLERIQLLAQERKVNLSDTASIRGFLADLDAEDHYCIAKLARPAPEEQLIKRHLLWTPMLTDEIELRRALDRYIKAFPDKAEFVNLVIDRNFRPSSQSAIPITSIDEGVTVEGISRIFATLNSTGKLLTPFELVVSLLYPQKVDLADAVQVAREAYPYFGQLDATGDILLQTVALFGGKDTKKASLPKTITVELYRKHQDDAVDFLNKSGELLTQKIGLGLDQSNEFLTYPVIFSPMAFALKHLEGKKLSAQNRAAAEQKMAKWFIGGVLSRRYQQSTHDKQAKDKVEVIRWIDDGDEHSPQWMKDTYIPALVNIDPDGAMGKMIRALLNSRGLKDPYTGKDVGLGSGKQITAKHHIFPTRFVRNLSGWKEKEDSANLALNVMLVEQSTNASWLNLDPAQQIEAALKIHKEPVLKRIYLNHGIDDEAFEILRKEKKSRDDYYKFIALREKFMVQLLGEWGFSPMPRATPAKDDELVED